MHLLGSGSGSELVLIRVRAQSFRHGIHLFLIIREPPIRTRFRVFIAMLYLGVIYKRISIKVRQTYDIDEKIRHWNEHEA